MRRILPAVLVFSILAPYAHARGRYDPVPRASTGETAPSPDTVEVSGPPVPLIVWWPQPGEDPVTFSDVLDENPDLRLTAVLPDEFARPDVQPRISEAVRRGQVEAALMLPEDPLLALIQNSALVQMSPEPVEPPAPAFSWPDDVTGHVALARSAFRRAWRADASGLVMPWGVVAGPELETLSRIKIRWVLMPAVTDAESAGFFGGLAAGVARPVLLPAGSESSRADWLSLWLAGPGAPVLIRDVDGLQALASALKADPNARLLTASQVLDAVGAELPKWNDRDDTAPRFDAWMGEPEENRAWRALDEARRAVEEFKNTGTADLSRLDAAFQEIYALENGRFFFYFGDDYDSGSDAELKNQFMERLAKVYELLGRTPSGTLAALSGASPAQPADNVPAEGLSWTDEEKDDRGPGDYFYPAGSDNEPGSWDLTRFSVKTEKDHLVFSFAMGHIGNPRRAPGGFSAPLLDAYIDINGLPGAGSERLLPGRPGLVAPKHAWEYALSVSGWGAHLFRYAPGGSAKEVARYPAKAADGTVTVSVPRSELRGDPSHWSFAVAVMGAVPPQAGASPRPMSVDVEPGPDRFGGARAANAPPYIDLLMPEGKRQADALNAYSAGRDVVLPFVGGR